MKLSSSLGLICRAAVLSLAFGALPVAGHAIDMMSRQDIPQPPTSVRATSVHKAITVEWLEAPTPSITEYRIHRFDNLDPDHTLMQIASVPKNPKPSKHQYIDTTTEIGRTYTYFITSKDGFSAQSINSNMSTVKRGTN